jgi:hypothetical protein
MMGAEPYEVDPKYRENFLFSQSVEIARDVAYAIHNLRLVVEDERRQARHAGRPMLGPGDAPLQRVAPAVRELERAILWAKKWASLRLHFQMTSSNWLMQFAVSTCRS